MLLNKVTNYLKNKFSESKEEFENSETVSKTDKILNNLFPISSEEIQEIKEKADSTAKQILEQYPELSPIYKTKIDNFEFFISPKIKNSDKRLFFVNKNGVIEPRVSRLSGSGGKIHIFPGYDSDNISRFSKGDTTWFFDYEAGVVADERIVKIFEKVTEEPEIDTRFFTSDLRRFGYTTKNYETKEALNEFEKLNISTNLNGWGQVVSLSNAKNWYDNFDEEVKKRCDENPSNTMKYLFDNTKLDERYFSKFLKNNLEFWDGIKIEKKLENGKEKYKVGIGEIEGNEIFMIISGENDLYYVEQFFIENSPITSYGIPKYRLSSGIFTVKPKEYGSQIPGFIAKDIEKKLNIDIYSNETYSIIDYIQENPFIVAFKKYKEKNFKK